jgi:hypothetical protein
MAHSITQIIAAALFSTGILSVTGCTPPRQPPTTVEDLMEDRVTLDGLLMKCNQTPVKTGDAADCLNARIAVERLAHDADRVAAANRDAAFERRRDQLRQAEDRAREEQEAKSKVDPYEMPVVPVDGSSPPAGAPAIASQPAPGQP